MYVPHRSSPPTPRGMARASQACNADWRALQGVRSNVIAPGPIGGTEGMDRLSARDASGKKQTWGGPLGRDGDVGDIANATVFLFSDAARFITAQVIVVDGGCEHVRPDPLPYPESVLDPDAVAKMIRPRL